MTSSVAISHPLKAVSTHAYVKHGRQPTDYLVYMKICSFWQNKTALLPRYKRICPAVWLHFSDSIKMPGGKKIYMGTTQKTLCVVLTKCWKQCPQRISLQPLNCYLTNHRSKTSKICWAILVFYERTNERFSSMVLWCAFIISLWIMGATCERWW